MLQKDFIQHDKFKQLLEVNKKVQTVTDPKDGYNGFQTYGYSWKLEEYYFEGYPFNYYYKRFGNMRKVLRGQDREVLVLNLGAPGHNNEMSIDVQGKTVEEVYDMLQAAGRV